MIGLQGLGQSVIAGFRELPEHVPCYFGRQKSEYFFTMHLPDVIRF